MDIKSKVMKIIDLQNKADDLEKELCQKYTGLDGYYLFQKRGYYMFLKRSKEYIENAEPLSVIMKSTTLDNSLVNLFDIYYNSKDCGYDNYNNLERLLDKFVRQITGETNIWRAIEKAAVLDEEWTEWRNKELLYPAFYKYNYKDEYKKQIEVFLGQILDKNKGFEEDLERLTKLKNEIKELRQEAEKHTVKFEIYQSWETGLAFYILRTELPRQVFQALKEEGGLFYHKYDAEMEERFNGWATRDIEAAKNALEKHGYYVF